MAEEKNIVGHNGHCPICGSRDGMIVKSPDGRFRNICRVMGCEAFYTPAPFEGYPKLEDTQNPYESDLLKDGTCTGIRYLNGPTDEK